MLADRGVAHDDVRSIRGGEVAMEKILTKVARSRRPAAFLIAGAILASCLSTVLGGCGGGGGATAGGGSSGTRIAGDVTFASNGSVKALSVAPPRVVSEDEPNDHVDGCNTLGTIRVGDRVRVVGHTSALDESDPFDGFQFRAPQAVRLAVTVAVAEGVAADLDVVLYDVASMQPAGRIATEKGTATGSFVVHGTADLVVRGAFGGADYEVMIEAQPVTPDEAGKEPVWPESIGSLDTEASAFRRMPAGVFFGAPTTEFRAGQGLVAFEEGAEAAATAEALLRGVTIEDPSPNGHSMARFEVPAGLSGIDAARWTISRVHGLRGIEGVRYAEPNFRRRAFATPNDTRYSEQWDLPLIHAPEAWDVTTGSSSVIVAVIDTGQTSHPDLAGRQIAGYDFITDPAVSGDGGGRDSDPTDVGDSEAGEPSSFHGTHVAGTIGAASNNSKGVAGITWGCKIMHLRVLGKGGGDDSDITEAIRYAAGLSNATGRTPTQRANVINMSLGGGGFDQAMQDAITAARNAGVVICAAAGNAGDTSVEYPASFSGVLSVAAVDRHKAHASYSNRNSSVDIAAPGGDSSASEADGVLSTIYDDSVSPAVATYAFYDGTSMATPHVAAVAALVFSVAPSLTAAQVESILENTAEDLGAAGRDNSFGYGLVNAYAAVVSASGGTPPPPPPPPPPDPTPTPTPDPSPSDVFVLLVDAATDATVDQVAITAGGQSAFAFTGVAAGTYVLYAGTDDNGDGYIGDSGEWFGAYGGDANPKVISIAKGRQVDNLSIVLSVQTGGFARRR